MEPADLQRPPKSKNVHSIEINALKIKRPSKRRP
jgi:hypothetical protein